MAEIEIKEFKDRITNNISFEHIDNTIQILFPENENED